MVLASSRDPDICSNVAFAIFFSLPHSRVLDAIRRIYLIHEHTQNYYGACEYSIEQSERGQRIVQFLLVFCIHRRKRKPQGSAR